jgi:hypothetical protein
MDFYPSEFSPEARDRIDKEKIRAYRELLPSSVYDSREQDLAIRCVMRIFLAFAKDACALRKERGWTIERVEGESAEFWRRLTLMVVFDKFPGLDRRWISSSDGSIVSDVERLFKASAEWKEYEELLLATPLGANTNAAPKPFEDAIVSRKRMLKHFGETLGALSRENTPILEDPKPQSLVGIERSDVETLRHEVWMKFFDEANLPRTVELQWESVLSSRTIPSLDVDLALTLALTQEYAKAVSRACAGLSDLLVTAAISREGRIQITDHSRETLWRECLDFAHQLIKWDIFASWVDRVTHIRWEVPITADGSPDREQLEKAVKPKREFFERRIGMYRQGWLDAIDRAIELRCTVSVGYNVNASAKSEKPVPSMTSAKAEAAQGESVDRRAMINAYIQEVLEKTGKRITRKHIWSKAGYTTRTEFERWERRDRRYSNRSADETFTRILREKPHLR